MGTQSRRVQMTKRILKESLLEMLENQCIEKISIRALCELADINRSTFYKYYSSQYDLLHEMENDLLQQVSESFAKMPLNLSPEQHLENNLTYMKKHMKLCKILIKSNVDENFQEQLLGLSVLLDWLSPLMKGYTEREFSYLKTLFLYGGYHIFVQWIENDCLESPQELSRILISLMKKFIPLPTNKSVCTFET